MTTPTLPTVTLCNLCPRPRTIGGCCWTCHDHLADLLGDRPGTLWNPDRPGDPYVPPGIGWLMQALHAHNGQRATRPEPGGPRGFGPSSPADDHILALRDPRTQLADEFTVLAGGRWLGCTARELAERDDVREARDELRATQRHLLAVLGDGFGARLVGYCRMDAEGADCGAPLWCPPQPPHGNDEPGIPPSVRCPACAHVYGGLALVRMGQVDTEDVAA